MREAKPRLDAEKILASDELLRRFKPPPGVGSEFIRGTLLVGRRGSGKTMLLRKLEHSHDGLAMYGDLRTILNPISSDTGAAGLTFDVIRPSDEEAIRRKTVSLLGFWFASQCEKLGIPVKRESLRRILPPSLQDTYSKSTGIQDVLYGPLAWSSLDDFRRGADVHTLTTLINETAQDSRCESGILILLDRAERIAYPCIDVVTTLLDQTNTFTAIVATRPGVMGSDQSLSPDSPVPGDHYAIHHLGCEPYSSEWEDFRMAALKSWIPMSLAAVPEPERQLLLRLSRDSLRCALELVHSSIDEHGEFQWSRTLECLNTLRIVLLDSIQGQLRHLNPDISGFLNRIRSKHGNEFFLPVCIALETTSTPALFEVGRSLRDMTRDEKFVQLALRTGLLTTLNGVAWHPYASVEAAEVFPVFLWREGDRWSSI